HGRSTQRGNRKPQARLLLSGPLTLILFLIPADKKYAASRAVHLFQPERLRVFAILGILVVFGAVLGGYLMEKGNLLVLVQPAELLIIGGAALGTLLIANPIHILKGIGAGIGGVFGAMRYGKARYLET